MMMIYHLAGKGLQKKKMDNKENDQEVRQEGAEENPQNS